MRAIKNEHGFTTFLTSQENKIFRKCEFMQFCPVNSLTEREQYLAEDMVRKGILTKVSRSNQNGYKITPQVNTLQG